MLQRFMAVQSSISRWRLIGLFKLICVHFHLEASEMSISRKGPLGCSPLIYDVLDSRCSPLRMFSSTSCNIAMPRGSFTRLF
ncbi:hypothetical protein QL285_010457 [Trifolium repens]|nr:hypothetical protein QL285_010457 [Trifolium repens]